MTAKLTAKAFQSDMEQLAHKIRAMREMQGLSLRDLADKAGVSHNNIQNIETGKSLNPSFLLIKAIATAFGLTLDELMSISIETCPTCGGKGWVKGDDNLERS